MADPVADAEALRARMVAGLVESGELSAPWRHAFLDVERHAFIPPLVWRHERGREPNDLIPFHRTADPDTWLELAYADAPVNTQVDDGHPAPDGTGHEVTSSASMPAIVADMLNMLDVQPGMRVLEIGTGTGYNAALLAHRLGGQNVTSVELDEQVAERARAVLEIAGYDTVTVVTGDGAHGHLAGAPYDRLIATAGVFTVPYAWIAQTKPGGRVVLPLSGTYQPPGILTLTVHDNGTATGRLGRRADFMALRAQRAPRPRSRAMNTEAGVVSHTDLHPYHVVADRDAAVTIGLLVPNCYRPYDPQTEKLWLLDHDTDSWASVKMAPDPPYEVLQGGQRKLWDEVHAAYQGWLAASSPPVGAWLVTVEPTGQRVELSR